MPYIQFNIQATDHQQEELIALLDDFQPTGFEQKDNELIAYFNEEDFNEKEIHHLLHGYKHQLSSVAEKNWNEEWEKNFDPVVVEKFCAIRAHFHQPIEGVEHEIIITPKMSFGTGHHATTYMMMQHMQKIDFTSKTVFDFGTGTGILAILAKKLQASHVMAIDNDEWSIENAKENAERNNCTDVTIALSIVLPQNEFDIVLANINKNVLLAYMDGLKKTVRIGGILLISGILIEDETALSHAANEAGFRVSDIIKRDKWLSIKFVKTF